MKKVKYILNLLFTFVMWWLFMGIIALVSFVVYNLIFNLDKIKQEEIEINKFIKEQDSLKIELLLNISSKVKSIDSCMVILMQDLAPAVEIKEISPIIKEIESEE